MEIFGGVKHICPVLLLLVINFISYSAGQDGPIITVEGLGQIRGKESSTIGNSKRTYYSFLGMKYGEPPTGSRRFLPSSRTIGELEPGGVYDATKPGLACIQPVQVLPVDMSEDCLYINVHTPKLRNDGELLPVLFNIHGGAFTVGNGHLFDGARLLNHDMVLVTFNYRMGLLGFYSLMNEEVPGNAGMYDTINALRWTKDFIKGFGGDPSRIFISGQSSGSASVTHLLASPMISDLNIAGAIGVSGSALAAWGTTEDPMKGSLRVAELSLCHDSSKEPDLKSIATCMQNVDAQVLVNALMDFQIQSRNQGSLGFDAVSPVVQSFEVSTLEKFLPKHPRLVYEAKEQANVPLMMGTTRHDGSYVLGVFYNRYLKDNDLVNNTDFMKNEAVSSILKALDIPDEFGVYESIAKTYLGGVPSGNFFDMYPGFIDLFSVFFFKASSYHTALYHSKLNPDTYWYSFDYKGSQTVFPVLFALEPVPFKGGITHGDDLIYLFQMPLIFLKPEEQMISDRMVDYWANFIIHGNPTPSSADSPNWLPLSATQTNFMSINTESALLEHYEDHWSDIGWEVEPTIPPTESTTSVSTTRRTTTRRTTTLKTTTVVTTPTTPPTTTVSEPTSTGDAASTLYSIQLVAISLITLKLAVQLHTTQHTF